MNLTDNGKSFKYINWFISQSNPDLQPPYSAGSSESRLVDILEKGHKDVLLTEEELEKIRCWIDLGVPFCGDYEESALWNDKERRKYQHFYNKRQQSKSIDQESFQAIIQDNSGVIPQWFDSDYFQKKDR